MFEFTISLGNLLNIIGMLVTAALVVITRGNQTLDRRLDLIEAEMRGIIKKLEEVVRQDERLNALDHRITAIETRRHIQRKS